SYTTSASARPECGRASAMLSTSTAIGATGPIASNVGAGRGVGDGEGDGTGVAGAAVAEAVGPTLGSAMAGRGLAAGARVAEGAGTGWAALLTVAEGAGGGGVAVGAGGAVALQAVRSRRRTVAVTALSLEADVVTGTPSRVGRPARLHVRWSQQRGRASAWVPLAGRTEGAGSRGAGIVGNSPPPGLPALVEMLALVRAGVGVRRGTAAEEHELRQPGAALDPEAVGVVDNQQRLGAAFVARVPDGEHQPHAASGEGGTGPAEGDQVARQPQQLGELRQVAAGRQRRPAVGVERQRSASRELPQVAPQSGGPLQPPELRQRQVQPVRLHLRRRIGQVLRERRIGSEQRQQLGAGEDAHWCGSGAKSSRRRSIRTAA